MAISYSVYGDNDDDAIPYYTPNGTYFPGYGSGFYPWFEQMMLHNAIPGAAEGGNAGIDNATRKVFLCPGHENPYVAYSHFKVKLSYGYNRWITRKDDSIVLAHAKPMTKISIRNQYPNKTLIFGDSYGTVGTTAPTHTQIYQLNYANNFSIGPRKVHSGGMNAAFHDGHVATANAAYRNPYTLANDLWNIRPAYPMQLVKGY